MGQIASMLAAVRQALTEIADLSLADLQFAEANMARVLMIVMVGGVAATLLARSLMSRRPGHARIAVPALLGWTRSSRVALVRHTALAVALLGLPFFVLALADPLTALKRQETSYPGRRISLMIDASSSMLSSLPSSVLAKGAPNDAAFFTTVGAARYFVELRSKREYRDLMSLIEFGDDAYVITPFTSDYESILLSISLIGDWNEFMAFPDQGTVIARAIDQSVGLFSAFDFLEAAGNVMLIFSDGMDAEVLQDGRTVVDVLADAEKARIPVYFIRTGTPSRTDARVSDVAWRSAVARTGGRFYSAADEQTILRVLQEIDQASAGRIETRQYSTRTPHFASFALVAVVLWSLALTLRLTTPWFQKFP